jgi:putative membrane protein
MNAMLLLRKTSPSFSWRVLSRPFDVALRASSTTPPSTPTKAIGTTTTTTTTLYPATAPSEFYIPRDSRTSPDSMYCIDGVYDGRIKRRRRIDPTRELNYTTTHWDSHKSVYRRIRHVLTTFGASPFQRLMFPDFFVTSIVTSMLIYHNEIVAIDPASMICMDASGTSAVAAGTTAIALLTGFRLNASYGRYADGRRRLGEVNAASRDLAANALMWMTSRRDADRTLLLIKAYSVALTFHLNEKGNHPGLRRSDPDMRERVYAEYRAEMTDVYRNDERFDEDLIRICAWHRDGSNVPLGVATLVRGIIARNGRGGADDAFLGREMDAQVRRLVSSLGACEGLLRTPIPTCFTRHASRLLFVWSNMIPFAIYSACGPLWTLPATIGISYTIMGIEDIR